MDRVSVSKTQASSIKPRKRDKLEKLRKTRRNLTWRWAKYIFCLTRSHYTCHKRAWNLSPNSSNCLLTDLAHFGEVINTNTIQNTGCFFFVRQPKPISRLVDTVAGTSTITLLSLLPQSLLPALCRGEHLSVPGFTMLEIALCDVTLISCFLTISLSPWF